MQLPEVLASIRDVDTRVLSWETGCRREKKGLLSQRMLFVYTNLKDLSAKDARVIRLRTLAAFNTLRI